MKKILIILLFPLGTGLSATDDKKSDVIKQYNNQRNQEWPDRSRSRSISYDTSDESSDASCDDSSSDYSDSDESSEGDTSSHKLIESLRHQGGLSQKMLERLMPYGGHMFGGAMVLLIAYKFYRAGYL
jgi:hypothetical protein